MDPDLDGATTQKEKSQVKTTVKRTTTTTTTTEAVPVPEAGLRPGQSRAELERVSGHSARVSTDAPKQHSVIGIILVIVASLLLLAGIGFAIWYFVFHNNPDKIMLDAVDSVLTSENLVAEGSAQVAFPASDESSIETVFVNFDSSSQNLPNATNVKLDIRTEGEGKFEFDLGTVQLIDGVAYLRVNGIMALIEQIDDAELYEEMADFIALLDLVDGEWWRISVPEVTEYLGLGETGEAINQLYTCTVDLMKQDRSGELRQLYQDHKFLTLKNSPVGTGESGWTTYQAEINQDALAQFINGIFETPMAEQYYDCYNKALTQLDADTTLSAESIDEVTAEQIAEVLPADFSLKLTINNWTHELRDIDFSNLKLEDATLMGMIRLRRIESVVTEPENYRPITELLDEIMQWIVIPTETTGAYEE